MDLNIDFIPVVNKIFYIKEFINKMNFIELSNELDYIKQFGKKKNNLTEQIEETRERIVVIFVKLFNKISNLTDNLNNGIEYIPNLESINAIILNLENNFEQMNQDELIAHYKWLKHVDKELKLVLNKISYFESLIYHHENGVFRILCDKIHTMKAQAKLEMEQIKLNENHNSLDDILEKIKGLYYREIIETLIANCTEPKINLVSYTPGENFGNLTKTPVATATISETVGVKKIKTKLYEINIYHRENKIFTCSCSHFKKENAVCKHICFLVCSIGKIIKLGFFKSNTLTDQDLIALTDTLANFVT